MITSVLNRQSLNRIATERRVGVFLEFPETKCHRACLPTSSSLFPIHVGLKTCMNLHESESTYVAEGDKASEITKAIEEAAN